MTVTAGNAGPLEPKGVSLAGAKRGAPVVDGGSIPPGSTTKTVYTVTLDDQKRLGVLPEKKTPQRSYPTARELTAADPIASAPGPVRRSRGGPWVSGKARTHFEKMRRRRAREG